MKKLFLTVFSVAFIGLGLLFISCRRKNEPTPATTKSSGSSTTGTTTSGSTSSATTTSGSTTSGSTTSATTSGTTPTSVSGTGTYNDGTNSNNSAEAYGVRTVSTIIKIADTSSYPEIYFESIPLKVSQTGTFTSADSVIGAIQYDATVAGTWSTAYGGTCSVTITTNSTTQLIGTYTLNAKNIDSTFKNVNGSFKISF